MKKRNDTAGRPRRALQDAQGRLRMGIAAPAATVLFFGAQILGAYGFGLLGSALLELWGVTPKSLPYAPAWLQTALGQYGSLESIAGGLLGFLAALICAKRMRGRSLRPCGRHILLGCGIGCAVAAAAFLILRLTGSVRCMAAPAVYPLAEIIGAAGAFAAALGPEALLGGFFAPEMRLSGWRKAVLFTALNALMYIMGAVWSLPSVLCVFAMSAVCAVLYEKRSYAAAAAVRSCFAFSAHRVFGFSAAGAPGIFFETYPVSRDWLTGGDAGLEAGWLCALLFAACAAVLWKHMKKHASGEDEQ